MSNNHQLFPHFHLQTSHHWAVNLVNADKKPSSSFSNKLMLRTLSCCPLSSPPSYPTSPKPLQQHQLHLSVSSLPISLPNISHNLPRNLTRSCALEGHHINLPLLKCLHQYPFLPHVQTPHIRPNDFNLQK